MLDAPGVLPMSFHDQLAAQRLAICNDIGEASYVDSLVAAALLETLRELPGARGHCAKLMQRYGVPLTSSMTGEDYVHAGMHVCAHALVWVHDGQHSGRCNFPGRCGKGWCACAQGLPHWSAGVGVP